ncbi:hypothetical protein [Romboutsia lituseburensis]|uniref:hypothetical protein n=1 Tax=Romboutsia lituseburensis TaxID=1537 RepID=UPI00215AF2D9|nr:hypothetical protein [Romboutsia lituseburensis]MCR8745875.1 hypothetical protein [Romboutsia lituseburensis]
MLNINVLYIYPKIMEINREINLFRIVDNNIKETLVIYGEKVKKDFKLLMINTMSGEIKNLGLVNELEIEKYITKVKAKENEFTALKDLNEIEKYILNLSIN